MNDLSRKDFLKLAGAGAAALSLPGCAPFSFKGKKQPNILFIMLDDLGPEWVSAYGAEGIETPNADKLADGGMLFNNVYSMPQCTPTRVTLLTGQYPNRTGWINHWDVPRWGGGAHFDWKHYTTFASILKSAGYATAAAGKWQVNDFRVTPDALQKHGFDEHCMWTGYESDNPPSAERYWDPYIATSEGSKTYEGKFGEDVFSDFLIDFMQRHKDEPMLMYYPMAIPHGPFVKTPDELDVDSDLEKHKAMVRYADKMLGKMVNALEELGLREDTIIIWTSDNGTTRKFSNKINGREIRGGKARTTESGIWVPFIVNAPGLVPAGVKTDALTDFTDMLPTFAELAGAKLPDDLVLDGKSIAPLILGKQDDSNREWIMAMGGKPARMDEKGVLPVHKFRDRVLRDKQYKLYVDTNRQSEALYDLKNDPGETTNILNSTDPKVIAARKKLEAVVATFPEQDARPKYDPTPPQPWDMTPEKMDKFLEGYKHG